VTRAALAVVVGDARLGAHGAGAGAAADDAAGEAQLCCDVAFGACTLLGEALAVAKAFCKGKKEGFDVPASDCFLARAVDERDAVDGRRFTRSGVDREKTARRRGGRHDAAIGLPVAGQIFTRVTVFFYLASAAVGRDAGTITIVDERAALTERARPGRRLVTERVGATLCEAPFARGCGQGWRAVSDAIWMEARNA
jgi:hypothetical protein